MTDLSKNNSIVLDVTVFCFENCERSEQNYFFNKILKSRENIYSKDTGCIVATFKILMLKSTLTQKYHRMSIIQKQMSSILALIKMVFNISNIIITGIGNINTIIIKLSEIVKNFFFLICHN